MKDLCKAMGIELKPHWRDWGFDSYKEYYDFNILHHGKVKYSEDDFSDVQEPSPTDEAFCWKALQYMMGREDWREFYFHAWDQYILNDRGWRAHGWLPWLLDPARFIGLCDEWVREHGGREHGR